MNVSQGLDIRINDYGKAYIYGIGSCVDEHLVIPSTYSGLPVVGIAEKAFCRNISIKSVILPCSVLYIDAQAFAWCRRLATVQLSSVSDIGERAFMGCDALQTATLGDFLENVGEKAFAYCASLEKAVLPDSTVTLGASAFEGCRRLTEVSLSNRINVIESGTFYACEKLKTVKTPRDLSYIDDFAFAYCISLAGMSLLQKTIVNTNAFFECDSRLNNKVS